MNGILERLPKLILCWKRVTHTTVNNSHLDMKQPPPSSWMLIYIRRLDKLQWVASSSSNAAMRSICKYPHFLTLVILGWVQRLFPDVACIHPPPSASCSGTLEFPPPVHSCRREHFLSWTHQPHSNLGSAFRHIPQLSRNALHLYKWAAWERDRTKRLKCSICTEWKL